MADANKQKKYSPHDRLRLGVLVDLLVAQVRDQNDDLRQAKSKVRQRILYAEKKQGIFARSNPSSSDANAEYVLGEVVAWARKKWLGRNFDLPAIHTNTLQSQSGARESVSFSVRPPSYEACLKHLKHYENIIQTLEKKLAAANAEITELKPKAERYVLNSAKNRANALNKRR